MKSVDSFRARVSHVDAETQSPEHPEQIGGQYPKSKVSDFHFVEEGDSAFFVGIRICAAGPYPSLRPAQLAEEAVIVRRDMRP